MGVIYSAYGPKWDPLDVNGLEEQIPGEASYNNTVFDIELDGDMTIRKWNKFSGLINQAFDLVEYDGMINISMSIPAISQTNFSAVENRLSKLKCVFSSHQPVPACWDWTVTVSFKKFPYWNQVQDTMRSVERAVYGKNFNKVERKTNVRRISGYKSPGLK